MKKLKVIDASKCMACLQCVAACSTAFYREFDQAKSCIQVIERIPGKLSVQICIQCGKCARTCEHGAITQNSKGTYVINKKLCVSCGKCVEACPMHVIVQPVEGIAPTKCIACGMCAKQCPMGILDLVE